MSHESPSSRVNSSRNAGHVRPYRLEGNSTPQPYANMSSYQAWTLPSIDSLRISASHSLTLPYCLLLMDVPCPRTSRSATPQARNPSHYHALGAASRLGIVIADIHRLDGTVWCRGAAAGRVSLHFAVEASDFADDIVECLVDVDPRLC